MTLTISIVQGVAGSLQRQRITSVQRRFAAFLCDAGFDGANGCRFDPDLIEAFVVGGLPGAKSSTRGTYRSTLARLVPEADRASSRGTRFAGSTASAPYASEERRELMAMASSQRHEDKRRSTRCVLAAGIGAGLAGGELVRLRGSHVMSIDGTVRVVVGGALPRAVPVAAIWGEMLLGLAEQAGNEHLFHPGPSDRIYKNFVNNFCRHLACDPALPRLSSGRCRSSFICDHLAAGTPLSEVLAVTGIEEVESLARYGRHVEGMTSSKADLRRRLNSEDCR